RGRGLLGPGAVHDFGARGEQAPHGARFEGIPRRGLAGPRRKGPGALPRPHRPVRVARGGVEGFGGPRPKGEGPDMDRLAGRVEALPVRAPAWIREKRLRLSELHEVKRVMRSGSLHTVCEEARCPNRGECFSRGTATFLLMGDVCTRACGFCDIANGRPL